MALVAPTAQGLYVEAGDFFIDPWRRVERALVTHAHADHARWGCDSYLCSSAGVGVLRERVGRDAAIEGLLWGETREINGVRVSFHPAGHILGSAQIRLEHRGEVWVVSGDYKTTPGLGAESFEPVRCHTFISECTFGLPVYRWPDAAEVYAEIDAWWRSNREEGRTSICFAYALGKAQRVLAGVDAQIGPIGVHGSVAPFLPLYEAAGHPMPPVVNANSETAPNLKGKGLIVAPASTHNTPWIRRFAPCSLAFASGWMRIRGARRRRALDRGFVLSDHADWPGLLEAIRATGAERVGLTHGNTTALARWLQEQGTGAWELPTRYTGEALDPEDATDVTQN